MRAATVRTSNLVNDVRCFERIVLTCLGSRLVTRHARAWL